MKLSPSDASLVRVCVVLRERTSISPDESAVKRSLAVKGIYVTFDASPRTAAATASQTAASIPTILPASFGAEKPGTPPLTPQRRSPRD